MLRVNVGLSRKLSHDFNSTGFSINVDGEIGVALDDPEYAIEKIRELFDLADEALKDQIARQQHSADDGSNRRCDSSPTRNRAAEKGASRSSQRQSADYQNGQSTNDNNREMRSGDPSEPATNKQVQYLLNLSKRQGMSQQGLEARIGSLFGRVAGVYDLTKKEAGELLDELTSESAAATRN